MERQETYQTSAELAIATVKMQDMRELYPLDKALKAGTIFPELDKPFFMGGVKL